MQCSSCHADNPPENRFCEECGTPLEALCPICRAQVRSGARFCGQCGAPLSEPSLASSAEPASPAEPSGESSPPAAPREGAPASPTPKRLAEKILTARSLEGERRQVTILFLDMAGFTSLAEKLDPEDVHRIVNRCFELITAEIHRFEGTVNQYMGDGVMALFGAPIAHEDAPRRAVHSALGIQRTVGEFSQELEAERGFGVHVRIGIHTGIVVVGKITDDLRMDYTAVGDTTNLAARLEQNAQPGSVLISDVTHRLVSGFFETRELGPLRVKGHEATIDTFEVLRARGGRRARLEVAVERGLTPLIGRDQELASLRDLFQQAKRGMGQVAFLAGDAGIGKSRLLLELRRQLADDGEKALWLEGRCVSFGQTIPLLPVVDQVRQSFGIEEADGEPEIIAKVESGMRRLGGLEAHIAYIRYLLSVDPGDESIPRMDPSARRKKTFEALWASGLHSARRQPIVFVVEDLHWVDTSTSDYLSFLLDSVAGAPMLVLLTYRIGYTPPFGSRSYYTTVSLKSLSERETLAMAGRVLGATEFPAELSTALMDKAGGVPLFIEEVTKTLLDLGILRRENGNYRMVKGIAEVDIPETIQGIIMARLDRLGENGKRTVQLAAVIGRQFLHRLLERVAELPGQLDGLLRELKALEIIYEQGLLPEPAYIFKHAFIQDVAYNSLLVQHRKELHSTVAQAIEELYADRLPEHYGELAHHFALGEQWNKAMEYSLRAGDHASHAFANIEANQHYESAQAAADRVVPRPPLATFALIRGKHANNLASSGQYEAAIVQYREALESLQSIGDRHHEATILLHLSNVYNLTHEGEKSRDCNEAALLIAREIGDEALQAACLANRVQIAAAGYGLIAETIPDGEEALRLSRQMVNDDALALSLVFLGGNLQWQSDQERALPYLFEGIEVAKRSHNGFLFAYGSFHAGHGLTAKGDYEEALRTYQRLSDYCADAGDRFYESRVPNCIAGVHLEIFDLDGAYELNVEAEDTARRLWEWPEPRAHSLIKAGIAQFQKGELGSADELYGRAWAMFDEDVWYRWRWHIPLLRACGALALATGKRDEAWKLASQSLEVARRSDSRKHIVRAYRLQGEILAADGKLKEAAKTLTQSVQLAEQIGVPPEIWQSKAKLARALLDLGRDDQAAKQFEDAARAIESIAAKLTNPRFRHSYLGAEPVTAIYAALGRRPPSAESSPSAPEGTVT